jgi:hypothetical protein
VFHRPPHHESEDVAARIDHLMAAVFMADDTTRLAQLAAHVAPAFVYVSRSAVVDGAQGLSDAFSHYRHEAGRHAALHRTSAVDLHHGYFRYAWVRTEDDAAPAGGWSFGQLDAEGRITRIVSFDELRPA